MSQNKHKETFPSHFPEDIQTEMDIITKINNLFQPNKLLFPGSNILQKYDSILGLYIHYLPLLHYIIYSTYAYIDTPFKLRLEIEKANDYFHTQKRNLRKMARLLHIDRHPILD